MIFTHFGSDHFDLQRWTDVLGSVYCAGLKPNGGLWGSAEDEAGRGWKEWCESNDFEVYRLKRSFKFRLTDNARVLKVYCDELDKYIIPGPLRSYDWLKIKKDYDAVYIAAGSDDDLYMKYYGWDCNSIVVLNKDVIEEVKKS